MGFFVAVFVLLFSGGLFWLFGCSPWLLFMIVVLLCGGLTCTLLYGHRGFKNGVNSDMVIYIAVVALALAIVVPQLSCSLDSF